MKKLLLPIVMLLAGTGAGIGAGMFLGGDAPAGDTHADADGAGDHEAEAKGDSAAAAVKDGKGGGSHDGPVEYARLSNQFIVPVVNNAEVVSLVVMSLTLEVTPGGTDQVFQTEPRLRDSFLRVMFDHANVGGFDAGFTQSGTMTLLRRSLLEAARATLGDAVRDVLIVDIVRQAV